MGKWLSIRLFESLNKIYLKANAYFSWSNDCYDTRPNGVINRAKESKMKTEQVSQNEQNDFHKDFPTFYIVKRFTNYVEYSIM